MINGLQLYLLNILFFSENVLIFVLNRGRKLCEGDDEKVVSGKGCVTPGQTKITQVVNYETKQLHCMTTPNQKIILYDNTKANNYIV